jgi:hypothetical protein
MTAVDPLGGSPAAGGAGAPLRRHPLKFAGKFPQTGVDPVQNVVGGD